MEEKERFELFGEHCIKDNSPDARPQLLGAYVACVILNDQDKENQRLKQAQKQLAIMELEKLKEEMVLNGNDYCEIRQGTSPHNPTDYAWFNYVMFRKLIDKRIKELKGE